MSAVNPEFVQAFAAEWIAAWNSRDLDRVLAHYDDDFEMSSPLIVRIAGDPSGRLRGKQAVRAYWTAALELLPDLSFELVGALAGVDSIALHYKGAGQRPATEVFFFGPDRKVRKAFAHY
jgi:ketosteroid isomerase-like protein